MAALIIPLEAYFAPRTFLARVAASVPAHYTFAQAFTSSSPIRQQATQLVTQLFLSTLIIPIAVALVAFVFIPNANLLYMLGGALFSLVLGFGLGILPRLFWYFNVAMAAAIGFGVWFGSVLAVLLGIYSSISGSIAPDSIAAAVDSPAGQAANAILLGGVLGACIRILIGAYAQNTRQAMLVGLIIIVPFGILFALFSQPRVIMTNRAASISMILAFTGWFALPLQLVISLVNRILVATRTHLAPKLWLIAPVRWDDFLVVPMPDTVPVVAKLYDTDRDQYRQAVNRIQRHAFQARYAKVIQQRVIQR